MTEELSKRIDDIHKRFDDLRADLTARLAGLDKRIDDRFAGLDKRIDDLRADMSQRFEVLHQRLTDIHGTLRTFMWVVSGWFTFLAAVLAIFGFLRR